MTIELWVSTRKGLFGLVRSSGGGCRIDRTAFLGEPLSIALADPRDGAIYAALNLGHFGVKLHRSDDDGATWTEVGVPTFPQSTETATDAPKGPSLKMIWELVPAGPKVEDGLWAGTIPGTLFHSGDRGVTWNRVESLWNRPERAEWMGGGYDESGVHSICVDPRDANRVLLGVSTGGVWRTTDRGAADWSLSAKGMFAEYMPPERKFDESMQDVHRLAQCPGSPEMFWAQHHNGVFHSRDGAANWSSVDALRPSSFGFAVAVHPQDGNTAWFVPATKDECRIPKDAKLTVTRTRDGGASCDVLTNGLPQEHCYDLVYRHSLDVDQTGDRLAFGSTTGHLWTTDDQGDHWTLTAAHLPPIYAVQFADR